MISDLPHTLYRPMSRRGNGKGKRMAVSASDIDEAARLNAELRDRRKAAVQRKRGYTVEEIFNGEADID